MRRVVDQMGDGNDRFLDADAHNGVNGTHQQLHQWRIATVLLLVFREGHSQQVVQTTRTDSRAMQERD